VITAAGRGRPDAGAQHRPCHAVQREPEDRPLDRPFFIAWDVPPSMHPGAAVVAHPCGASGISSVDVTGDAEGLRDWLGGARLPIEVTPGTPGVRGVHLVTPAGDLRIGEG